MWSNLQGANEIKVSIIVPVYNVEKYLQRCLDSLVNQTLNDLEIIVVNDGSPDNSQVIIDSFALRYPEKIKSYQKSNGGLSDARNYGIARASGRFIAFVDSDDWVDVNLYHAMVCLAEFEESDIVCCNYLEHHISQQKLVTINNFDNKYTSNMVAWNKIFCHKYWLANDFKFKLNILHEDSELIPKVLLTTTKISYLDKFVYHYERRNLNSITGQGILHLEYFPSIISSLDNFSHSHNLEDVNYRVFLSDMIYIYIMDCNNISAAKKLFIEYVNYFNNGLSFKRRLFIMLMRVNFELGYKLHKLFKNMVK